MAAIETPKESVIFLHASDGLFKSRLQLLRHPIGPVPTALIVDHIRHGHQPGLTRPAPAQGAPTTGITDSIARQPPHLCSFLGRDNSQQTIQTIVFVHMHSLLGDKAEAKHLKVQHKPRSDKKVQRLITLFHTRFLPSCKHLRHSEEYQDA